MKHTTPSVKGSYVEPENFKGSKELWEVGYGDTSNQFGIFPHSAFDESYYGEPPHPICFISPRSKVNDADLANAKLISQSKEMAKALQDLKKQLAEMIADKEAETIVDIPFRCEWMINEIQQVLKNAGL